MVFDFRVVFTGICTFVPHSDGSKLCVLLPDGTRAEAEGKKALDDEPLAFHKGFLEFDPRDIESSSFPNRRFRTLWELERPGGRIHFVFPRDTDTSADFDAPGGGGSVAATVKLVDLVRQGDEHLVKVADWALDPVNPRLSVDTRVLAQVVFDRGVISGAKASRVEWELEGTLGQAMPYRQIYHDVAVTIASVAKVEVWFTPFGVKATSEKILTFTGSSGADTLRIANFCELNPLNWDGPTTQPRPDKDFKWHYEVLENRGAIKAKLGKGKLPHPTNPVKQRLIGAEARRYAAAGGDNCYTSFAPPKEFVF